MQRKDSKVNVKSKFSIDWWMINVVDIFILVFKVLNIFYYCSGHLTSGESMMNNLDDLLYTPIMFFSLADHHKKCFKFETGLTVGDKKDTFTLNFTLIFCFVVVEVVASSLIEIPLSKSKKPTSFKNNDRQLLYDEPFIIMRLLEIFSNFA